MTPRDGEDAVAEEDPDETGEDEEDLVEQEGDFNPDEEGEGELDKDEEGLGPDENEEEEGLGPDEIEEEEGLGPDEKQAPEGEGGRRFLCFQPSFGFCIIDPVVCLASIDEFPSLWSISGKFKSFSLA